MPILSSASTVNNSTGTGILRSVPISNNRGQIRNTPSDKPLKPAYLEKQQYTPITAEEYAAIQNAEPGSYEEFLNRIGQTRGATTEELNANLLKLNTEYNAKVDVYNANLDNLFKLKSNVYRGGANVNPMAINRLEYLKQKLGKQTVQGITEAQDQYVTGSNAQIDQSNAAIKQASEQYYQEQVGDLIPSFDVTKINEYGTFNPDKMEMKYLNEPYAYVEHASGNKYRGNGRYVPVRLLNEEEKRVMGMRNHSRGGHHAMRVEPVGNRDTELGMGKVDVAFENRDIDGVQASLTTSFDPVAYEGITKTDGSWSGPDWFVQKDTSGNIVRALFRPTEKQGVFYSPKEIVFKDGKMSQVNTYDPYTASTDRWWGRSWGTAPGSRSTSGFSPDKIALINPEGNVSNLINYDIYEASNSGMQGYSSSRYAPYLESVKKFESNKLLGNLKQFGIGGGSSEASVATVGNVTGAFAWGGTQGTYLRKNINYAAGEGMIYQAPPTVRDVTGIRNTVNYKAPANPVQQKVLTVINPYTGRTTVQNIAGYNTRQINEYRAAPTDFYPKTRIEYPGGNYIGKGGKQFMTIRQTPRNTFVPINVDNSGRTLTSGQQQLAMLKNDFTLKGSQFDSKWLI